MSLKLAFSAVGFVLFLALLTPLFSSAQETGAAAPIYCPNLSITMQKCDPNRPLSQQHCTDATTGGQVTELQRFLSDYYDLNPDDYVTGYFGRLTRDNVRKFQCEKGIVCSGSEENGYGVVGPRTRAKIASVCGSGSTYTPPPTDISCVWNGQTIPHGSAVTAYQAPTVPAGQSCVSEARICIKGVLTGSYQFTSCAVEQATNTNTNVNFTATPTSGTAPLAVSFSAQNIWTGSNHYYIDFGDGTEGTMQQIDCAGGCFPNPLSAAHSYTTAGTRTAKLSVARDCSNTTTSCTTALQQIGTATITVTAPTTTAPPTVTLTANGQQSVTLSPGAPFTIAWSSSNATSCNLTNASGQTNSTPPNVSGSSQGAAGASGTTYTYTLACTNSGGTTTKTASVIAQAPVATNVGSCIYKGAMYAEGQNVTVNGTYTPGSTFTLTCDNTVWVLPSLGSLLSGLNACDEPWSQFSGATRSDLGCSAYTVRAFLAASPRHGRAPLTVTTQTRASRDVFANCPAYTLSWGDASETVTPLGMPPYHCDSAYGDTRTHTYGSPGSYTISYTNANGDSITGNIRVD